MLSAEQLKKSLLLYAVTDRAWLNGQTLSQQVEQALQGGVTCIQLREKQLSESALIKEALALKPLCHAYGVPLLLDDSVPAMLQADADGVHVGQSDCNAAQVRRQIGPGKLLGVSAQTVEEALQAEQDGADYLGVGSIFPTATKTDAQPVSVETLRQICRAVSIPVVAIGGINRQNLLQLTGSGIAGVALVSAIFASPAIQSSCRELRRLSTQAVSARP